MTEMRTLVFNADEIAKLALELALEVANIDADFEPAAIDKGLAKLEAALANMVAADPGEPKPIALGTIERDGAAPLSFSVQWSSNAYDALRRAIAERRKKLL